MNQVLKKNHGVCSLQKIKEKGKMDWKGFKMFLLICPFILLVALFAYYPLYGWIYAFFDYKAPFPLFSCDFVGEMCIRDSWSAQSQREALLPI